MHTTRRKDDRLEMAAGEEPNDEELQKRADNSDTEKAALAVDYLVVGAGLASLAFLDELLSLDSKATFALVDKNEAPGGHWNFAYPFVRLHQPAAYYGVSSEPLAAGAKRSCMMMFEPFDKTRTSPTRRNCSPTLHEPCTGSRPLDGCSTLRGQPSATA